MAARERGAAVIDAFVDHYRRTGDTTSKLAELNAMGPRWRPRSGPLLRAETMPAPPKP